MIASTSFILYCLHPRPVIVRVVGVTSFFQIYVLNNTFYVCSCSRVSFACNLCPFFSIHKLGGKWITTMHVYFHSVYVHALCTSHPSWPSTLWSLTRPNLWPARNRAWIFCTCSCSCEIKLPIMAPPSSLSGCLSRRPDATCLLPPLLSMILPILYTFDDLKPSKPLLVSPLYPLPMMLVL